MKLGRLTESIGFKMLLLVVVALLLEAVGIGGIFTMNLERSTQEQLEQYRVRFLDEEKHKLSNYVNMAVDVVRSYYDRSRDIEGLKKEKYSELKQVVDSMVSQVAAYMKKNGDYMTRAEIEDGIREMVSWARFDNGNYIWINDMGPVMIMHPVKPELDGRDLSGFKDPKGVFLFNEMAKVCKAKGEGMVSYMWTKPGEEEPKLKISYVRLVPELGWIFGSGAWLEDITEEMKAAAKREVAALRVGESGYFWINDTTLPYPRMVMHPTVPALDGKLLNNPSYDCATELIAGLDGRPVKTDGKKNLFQAMVEVVIKGDNGQGFVTYMWPKPKQGGGVTTEAFPKLSYVKLFKPWGWIVGMGDYVDFIDTAVAEREEDLGSMLTGILINSATFSLVFFGLVIVISVLVIRRSLNKPMGLLVEYADCISKGDFDKCTTGTMKGEMRILKECMEGMVENLKRMIGEGECKSEELEAEMERANTAKAEAESARKMAEQARAQGLNEAADKLEGLVESLSAASGQLSDQVNEVADGADQQRMRTTETATSMEEMNATVLEVARNASQAAEGADEARRKAQEGAEIVEHSVRAINTVNELTEQLKTNMDELGSQAEAIGQVMNVINDIADQTNLLALNAAIEAARAGDAGRGFAVVADEVRKLAEKTMTATQEVGAAISAIQQGAKRNVASMDEAARAVDEATGFAAKSGESLEAIVGLVVETSDQVRSIATASEEQSAASEEINRAVDDITSISNDTAQGMGQASQAISDLADLAGELMELTRKLRQG